MLKLTWSVPCSSSLSQQSRINHRVVNPASHISPMSLKTLNANQLGFLLSLRNTSSNSKMDKMKCNCVQPGAPSGGPLNSWQSWIIGLVVSLILPFWKSKWGPLLAIKNKVDMVVDTVETVAEVVEQVAEKVEEIADDIGDKLPENTTLRCAVELVEQIAKETAKDAHLVDEFIEKVEEMEDKVESFLEPVVEDEAAKEKTKDVEQPNPKDN